MNLSHRPDLVLWKYLGKNPLQGPGSAGRVQTSVHFTTGGQGARTHCTTCKEQLSLAEHPPLSMSQDGTQKASPVGSNTSHREPG
jgi:hypothetical protein